MSDYLSCADTAKLARKALKEAYPHQKFSVRSSTYSMGASIRVGWTDGPQTADVDKVVGCFAGSGFDGMIDLKTSNSHWLYPDGTVELFEYQIGHSYGSHTLDLTREEVEDGAADYRAGVRAAMEIKNYVEGDASTDAWKAGYTEGDLRKARGARLVHFGADYVFTERELSPELRGKLERAVAFLSGDDALSFDNNKRYDFGLDGRAFTDYGSTLVYRLAQVDEDVLAKALLEERARRELVAAKAEPVAVGSGSEDGRRLYAVPTEGGKRRLEWRTA
jgi:hypothetical protein